MRYSMGEAGPEPMRTNRYVLPVFLLLGLFAVGGALRALLVVFADERDDARASSHAARRSREAYAARALADRLHGLLTNPHGERLAEHGVEVREAGARAHPRGALLEGGGRRYTEHDGSGGITSMDVDLPGVLAEVAAEMRARALLGGLDGLVLPALGDSVEVAALQPRVTGPVLGNDLAAAERRYRIKLGLAGGTFSLALGLVAGVLLVQRARQRFVALKAGFVAAVSHELRTPLAALRLLAETLEQRLEGHAPARDYPRRMVREIDGLSFLVDNVLSFRRLDGGRVVPRRSPVGLSDLLRSARAEAALHTETPVEIASEGTDGVTLDGDAELLSLLVRNLVRNACQYNASAKVRIGVRAWRGDDALFVRVSDNGVGVPAARREVVFGDFVRGAAPSDRKGGTGLGLAICRMVMEAHGGSIRLSESGPDGSTFELRFPRRAVLG